MIKIDRSNTPIPGRLLVKGTTEREVLKNESNFGTTKFKSTRFDGNIYGHETVKTVLKETQSDKCAYCESKVPHLGYGDVEHFRPKAGWVQEKGDPLVQPGYYWLAYEWSNLFFSCQICNQNYKKNHFPLSNPSQRALNHTKPISNESALLLNPLEDNPERHLEFERHLIKGKSIRGISTIDTCGLDRRALELARKSKLDTLSTLTYIIEIAEGSTDPKLVFKANEAKDLLRKWMENESEYSLMFKCAIWKSGVVL
jgi:uncharacterized protein (TIGR02646 family)